MACHGSPVFLLVAGACVALAQSNSGAKPPEAHQRMNPASSAARQPLLSDARLEAAIRARLSQSKIAADKFQVRVQGGVATIEGKTAVMQHKGVATRLARSAGAVQVNNHVEISDEMRKAAAANLAKGRRRAQIQRGEARAGTAPPRQSR
jgi:hypothetical protein